MRIERLGDLGSAPAVLRAIEEAGRRGDYPPPAALIGDWFDSGAVIAPSVLVAPVAADEVFDVSPSSAGDAVGGGWFGYLSYPDAGTDGAPARIPEAAGGWSDSAPAVVVYEGDHLEGIFVFEVIDEKITNLYAMRNPDKLTGITIPRTISR